MRLFLFYLWPPAPYFYLYSVEETGFHVFDFLAGLWIPFQFFTDSLLNNDPVFIVVSIWWAEIQFSHVLLGRPALALFHRITGHYLLKVLAIPSKYTSNALTDFRKSALLLFAA